MAAQEDANKKSERIKQIIKSRIRKVEDTESIINGIYNIIKRYADTKDPIIRYTLFLDKFLIIFDMLTALMNSKIECTVFSEDEDIGEIASDSPQYSNLLTKTEQVKEKVKIITEKLRVEFGKLSDYIQKDLYSPDHLTGSSLLREAEKDFDERK